MERINPLNFSELPSSTVTLMAVCALSGILVFLSVILAEKTSTKVFYSVVSFLLALTITYVTVFPIYFNESTEEIPFSEKTLEIDVDRSFYPTKSTKLIMRNEKGKCISSYVLEDNSENYDYILENCNKIQNQDMQPGKRFIIFNWCIVYEDESGELCCVNSEDYESKIAKDPFFKNIHQLATGKTN